MGRQHAARRQQDDQLQHRRGHLARRRRLSRWPPGRVLDAGRHLPAADRRRQRAAHHHRPGLGRAAALLARWPRDRVHQRSRRRQQPLAHAHRWQQRRAGDEGGLPPAQQPGVDAGRPVHHRAQAFHGRTLARRRRAVDVPRGRRHRRAADQAEERPAGSRRARGVARRALRLLQRGRDPRADVPVQQEPARGHLRDQAPRSRDRAHRHAALRPGRRGASAALAGRQAARLRETHPRQDRAARARSFQRRDAPGLGRPVARPAGGVGDLRPVRELRLDAGFEVRGGLGAGQALARRHGGRHCNEPAVHRAGRADRFDAAALRTDARRRRVHAEDDPRRGDEPRWPHARLPRARPPVPQGAARRRAAAADRQQRRLRIPAELQRGRRAPALHHLV